jgi:hypothetical protein
MCRALNGEVYGGFLADPERFSRASRFALEEAQHGITAITGDHQGTALCRRPIFYVVHDLEA